MAVYYNGLEAYSAISWDLSRSKTQRDKDRDRIEVISTPYDSGKNNLGY